MSTKAHDYTASLGKPTKVTTGSDSSSVYVWQDAETRFELHFAPQGQPRFWSRLIDRQRR